MVCHIFVFFKNRFIKGNKRLVFAVFPFHLQEVAALIPTLYCSRITCMTLEHSALLIINGKMHLVNKSTLFNSIFLTRETAN